MKASRKRRAALFLALVGALLAACQSPSPSPQRSAAATETASPDTSESTPASPSAGGSVALSPSASVGPTSGAASAYQALRSYEDDLLAGQFDTAWYLLSSATKSRWGSLAAFTKDRTAYIARAGSQYTMEISPRNTLSMSQWLVAMSWASKIDQKNAFLLSVNWSGFGGDPTRAEIWIANPIFTGWELYLVN